MCPRYEGKPSTPGRTGQERAARALRMLEAGRAVLLSQALDTRDDLTDLRRQHRDLATRFTDLRDRLDRPEDTYLSAILEDTPVTAVPGLAAEERRGLAEQLADTLSEIRTLDGFSTFGLPPAIGELLAQTESGPVVTCNISSYRSDALLLTTAGITAVELPGLTPDTVTGQVNSFHRAVQQATDAKASRAERRDAQRTLAKTLGWLWDAAAGPVLGALGYHSQPPPGAAWPEVWWAPGGLLGLLPIHAAGYHTEPPGDGGRRTVMDRVISSYTPTVRALRYARQRASAAGAPGRALIVAMPVTPGLPGGGELPNVAVEVARVRVLLPDAVILAEPSKPGGELVNDSSGLPTRANVLERLPGCPVAHFACHGASDPADPSKSLLLLHDHDSAPLTVASLASVRHDQLQLVYLSACRTAVTSDTRLLDEAIHLTAAFQLAGSRHVIGTLWEINDAAAVEIAAAFYRGLRTGQDGLDTSQAARALHHAVRAARARYPDNPLLWAAHLHAGA